MTQSIHRRQTRIAATGVLALSLLAAFVSTASAQEKPATEKPAAEKPGDKDKDKDKDKEKDPTTFAGLKFGAGLSFTYDTGKHDRVDSATIDANGIVRVDKTSNGIARIMLEAHYFFNPSKILVPAKAATATTPRIPAEREYRNWGWGPFVAVQPGSDEIINAIGLGLMFGFKYRDTSNQSFNLGFGLSVDPNTKVLGSEFVDGQPAPLGPDGKPLPIRYVTREQAGVLLLASFSWR